jgi:hypothetical protein
MKTSRSMRLGSLMAGLISLSAGGAAAQTDLFRPLPAMAANSAAASRQAEMRRSMAAKPYVIRSQAALLDVDALGQTPLSLNLFPDKKVKVLFQQVKKQRLETGDSKEVRIGKAEDSPGSDITLFIRDGSVSGRVALEGRIYTINPAGDGVHVITELDPEKMPKED